MYLSIYILYIFNITKAQRDVLYQIYIRCRNKQASLNLRKKTVLEKGCLNKKDNGKYKE